MRLVRIILGVALLTVGSILGDGYKDSLYLLWLSSSAFLMMYSEFITTTLLNANDQLELYKSKVSTLTILKSNGGNMVQMSIFPRSKLLVSREVKIDLFVTYAVSIKSVPDVKIITDSEWEILISNQPQKSRNYAGKYEYVLNNPDVTQIDEKFFMYSFYIIINKIGNHNFTIELDNGSIKGELKNILTVHQV